MNDKLKKAVIALSGGVDSAVAAYILRAKGYEVIGVNMIIYKGKPLAEAGEKGALKGCYGCDKKAEQEAAAAIAGRLEIPFYTVDCAEEYHQNIIAYFRAEYLAGRTPNPCVKCNELMKFGVLPEAVKKQLGFEFDIFATGHYANVVRHANGRYYLARAKDEKKDQTYFLYRLDQEQLARTVFPLGALSKAEVRKIAAEIFPELGLERKSESQDFYGGDYGDIIGRAQTKGEIITEDGKVVGAHNGFWNFTLGQRRGLGVAAPRPLYVVALDAEHNRVIVAEEDKTAQKSCRVGDFFCFPTDTSDIKAKVRSTQSLQLLKNIVNLGSDEALIEFVDAVKVAAPGQSAVLYQGDFVIGGGIIRR